MALAIRYIVAITGVENLSFNVYLCGYTDLDETATFCQMGAVIWIIVHIPYFGVVVIICKCPYYRGIAPISPTAVVAIVNDVEQVCVTPMILVYMNLHGTLSVITSKL